MEWQAKWVWHPKESNPRNFYLNVRKDFTIPADASAVSLAISADSRYTLWINGTYVGHGPIRGWQGKAWYYDLYDIGHLVKAGLNACAIQVQHTGISTFQYLDAPGGVICQIDCDGETVAATDTDWSAREELAFDRAVQRISCQQHFVESFDARKYDRSWKDVGFAPRDWGMLKLVAGAEQQPWGPLLERPIPFLTQEPVMPRRLIRSRAVVAPSLAHGLDIKVAVRPGDQSSDPHPVYYLLGTVVRNHGHAPARLALRLAHRTLTDGMVKVNGVPVAVADGVCEFEVTVGDSMLLINMSNGHDHNYNAYPVLEFAPEAELGLMHLGDAHAGCPWSVYGPYLNQAHADFQADWGAMSAISLNAGQRAHVVSESHFTAEQVFGLTCFAKGLPDVSVALERPTAFMAMSPDTTILHQPVEGDLELLLDFGTQTVGFLEFALQAPAGVILDFNGFEYMAPSDPASIQWTHGVNNTLRYVTSAGYQEFRSTTRRGFRFLSLTVRFPKGEPDAPRQSIALRHVQLFQNTYPYAHRGDFTCSDELVNVIWEISRHTVRLCSEDTYVDCPSYEQVFWVGDARNEALFAYMAFGDYALARHCLVLAGVSIGRSPLVESQVPSGWTNVIPAWSQLWAIACEEYLLYSDDGSFAEEIYPALKKQSDTIGFTYLDEEGLFSIKAWNFLDWAGMDLPGEGVVAHQNMLQVKAWRSAAAVADQLDKRDDAARWRTWATNLRDSIETNLWNEEHDGYPDALKADGSHSTTYSQQTQVMAYLCDIPQGERQATVASYLPGAPDGWVQVGSPFMLAFVLESLAKAGNFEDLMSIIRNGWGLMVGNDATTCWETFPKWDAGKVGGQLTRSHCHAWSAAPAYALPAYVLGVRPLEPGFRRFILEPRLLDLAWARGVVPTPSGDILVDLQRQDDSIVLDFTVPVGLEAVVYGEPFAGGHHTLQIDID